MVVQHTNGKQWQKALQAKPHCDDVVFTSLNVHTFDIRKLTSVCLLLNQPIGQMADSEWLHWLTMRINSYFESCKSC
jgi:hypothetical protein